MIKEEGEYPERLLLSVDIIRMLNAWYSQLLEKGYYIKGDVLYSLENNEKVALIHRIEDQSITLFPLPSYS